MNNMAVIISQNLLWMGFMLALVLGLSSYPTEARRLEASKKISIDHFGMLPSGPSYLTLDDSPHGPTAHTPNNPPHPVPSKTNNFGTLPSGPSFQTPDNPPHPVPSKTDILVH